MSKCAVILSRSLLCAGKFDERSIYHIYIFVLSENHTTSLRSLEINPNRHFVALLLEEELAGFHDVGVVVDDEDLGHAGLLFPAPSAGAARERKGFLRAWMGGWNGGFQGAVLRGMARMVAMAWEGVQEEVRLRAGSLLSGAPGAPLGGLGPRAAVRWAESRPHVFQGETP